MKRLLTATTCIALLVLTSCNADNKPKDTPTEALRLNFATATLKYSDVIELAVVNAPENATLTWSIDDDYAAMVDKNGKVTALAIGEAKVSATLGGKTASCIVTVEAIYDSCVFNTPTLSFGDNVEQIKTAEADADREFYSEQTTDDNDSTTLIFVDQKDPVELKHQYHYTILNIASDDKIGMSEAVVIVPSKNQEEASGDFFVSFAERNYYVGKLSSGEMIFMNKEKTHSILVVVEVYTEGETLYCLRCQYINVQHWDAQSAKSAIVERQSSFGANVLKPQEILLPNAPF